MSIVHPVSATNRHEILEHLLRLSAEDRRLRFGGPSSDETLAAYVARIDFARDAALGLRDDADALIGFTHVAGADGAIDGPERDAFLSLPPATPMSVGEEFLEGQLVLLDRALASAVRLARLRLAAEPA